MHLQMVVSSGHERKMSSREIYLPNEGHEMVLAQAVDVNVLDNDHPIVSLVKERVVDDIVEIMMVPLG